MYQQLPTLYALSLALKKRLVGFILHDAYTLNKEEILLSFKKDKQLFNIKALTKWRHCYLFFDDTSPQKPSNAQPIFENIIGKHILSVEQHLGNRSFQFEFENNRILVFKMYDALANIILFNKDEAENMFRSSIQNDHKLQLADFHKYQPDERITAATHFYIIKQPTDKTTYNFLITPPVENDTILYESDDVLDALTYYSRLSAAASSFNELKQSLEKGLKREQQHLQLLIKKNSTALKELQEKIPDEEIGHILMANIHTIKAGETTVELFDFYRNQNIIIKLKKDLNAQQNAEYYYRKSRNSKLETSQLQSKITLAEHKLAALEQTLHSITSANDIQALKPYIKQKKIKEENKIPFKLFKKNGFDIWVGKSAANNDQLTTKYAHKNDLWLHTKDVSGSHVIIKHKAGKNFPKDVIEHAAQLAAYYSKLKGSTLVPVTYTFKKFVRKPKGFEPGQVIIDKEEVILVTPSIG